MDFNGLERTERTLASYHRKAAELARRDGRTRGSLSRGHAKAISEFENADQNAARTARSHYGAEISGVKYVFLNKAASRKMYRWRISMLALPMTGRAILSTCSRASRQTS